MNKPLVTAERIQELWKYNEPVGVFDGYPVVVNDALCAERRALAFVTNVDMKQPYMIFLCKNIAQSPTKVMEFVIYHEIGHIMQAYGTVRKSDDYYLDEAYADLYAARRIGISVHEAIDINRSICSATFAKEELENLNSALLKLENMPLDNGMQKRGSDTVDIGKIAKGAIVVGSVSLLAIGISLLVGFIRGNKTSA